MRQLVCLVAVVVLAGAAVPVAAGQVPSAPVTVAEIEAVHIRIDDLRSALGELPETDVEARRRLAAELDDLNDEAIYLKVKARKQDVAAEELANLRSRVDAVEASIRERGAMTGVPAQPTAPTVGAAPPTPPVPGPVPVPPSPPEPVRYPPAETPPASSLPPSPPERVGPPPAEAPAVAPARVPGEIPVGQQLDVRMQSRLSSETAVVEDRFEATTLIDLYEGNRLLVPAGSLMRGVVSAVEKSGRLDRRGSLTLTFDQLTVRGVAYPVRAAVTQTIQTEGVKRELSKVGVGAGMGAIIGGIIAGPQGAAAGVFIGAGGALAAIPGKDVDLPSGAILRVRFDTAVVVN